ncbi:MAG: serine hydrolase domain-containing protein [Gemmatimonadota bacterium]
MHDPARRRTTTLLLTAVFCLSPITYGAVGALRAQDATMTDREIAHLLATRFDSLRQAAGIPGLAYAILRDTTRLAMDGVGFADVAAQRPVDAHTLFNIASVSKPISAVVALRLVEHGTLDLDRPLRRYDDFPEYCREVRAHGGLFFGDFACNDSSLTLRHVLSMTANGTPGTRFFYNPPAYSWTSRPMAQVAGRPFSDLVVEEVFRPAGMTESARIFRDRPLSSALAVRLAHPYHHDSSGALAESPPPPPQGDGAAGGVIATVADLVRFDIALDQGRLLTRESVKEMWTPTRTRDGTELPYGLGWFVAQVRGERIVWHTGLWEGAYSALYLKIPARKLTLILLANSDALQWDQHFDEALIERSPFARAFLDAFEPHSR